MSNVIITGANRGIGLELSKTFMESGSTVYGCCRKPEEANQFVDIANNSSGEGHLIQMDVTNSDDIINASKSLENIPIDVLINNAGAMFDNYGTAAYENVDDPDPKNYDYQLWEETLRINLLAPTMVLGEFVQQLELSKKPKVIMMSSGLASISNTWQAGRYAYRTSKVGLNMMVRSLGEWLETKGIIIIAASPGWTVTDMGGPNAPNTVQNSVSGMIKVIESLTLKDTGKFLNYDGKEIPW